MNKFTKKSINPNLIFVVVLNLGLLLFISLWYFIPYSILENIFILILIFMIRILGKIWDEKPSSHPPNMRGPGKFNENCEKRGKRWMEHFSLIRGELRRIYNFSCGARVCWDRFCGDCTPMPVMETSAGEKQLQIVIWFIWIVCKNVKMFVNLLKNWFGNFFDLALQVTME